jgi:flagellar assembly protein FliH
LFSRKVRLQRPIREIKVQDAVFKQTLGGFEMINHPEVKKYMSELQKSSYDEGFQKGLEEGARKKGEEVKTVVAAYADAVKKLDESKKQLVHQLEPQVIELCKKAAETVIGREIQGGSANLEAIVKPILSKVPDAMKIIIKVNPEDLNQMRQFSSDLVGDGKIESLEVVSDPSIGKGGVVIETDVGSIDAKLETRVEQMKKSLGGGMPSA